MRTGRIFTIVAVLCAISAATSNAATLSAADAKSHIGEQATVCGKVASERTATGSRGEPTFINLDAAYPNQIFTILIWGDNRSNVGPLPSDGERVCATGRIQEYRGVPEIVVKSKAQLSR
ncbi:MAG: DNA-binding protein [Acidobacteriota bacterium]